MHCAAKNTKAAIEVSLDAVSIVPDAFPQFAD